MTWASDFLDVPGAPWWLRDWWNFGPASRLLVTKSDDSHEQCAICNFTWKWEKDFTAQWEQVWEFYKHRTHHPPDLIKFHALFISSWDS